MITFRQQRNLQQPNDDISEFWDIIQNTLRVGLISQFDKLLEIMNASDDYAIKEIAKQLSEAAERPILTTVVVSEPAPKPPTSPPRSSGKLII